MRRKWALGKALSLSAFNQLVSSGTNFALGVYLVRVLSPAEFGLYGIGFAVCLFAAGIGDAALFMQMVVHSPDKAPGDRLAYAARILAGTAFLSVLALATFAVLLIAACIFSGFVAENFSLTTAVAAASVGLLLRNFFVREAYVAKQEARALAVNLGVALALCVTLAVWYWSKHLLNASVALWLYGCANLAGAMAGLFLARLPLSGIQISAVLADLREAWAGGRWAVGGVSVTWAQAQAYLYVTALWSGPVAVGYANAAKLLLGPIAFLVPAITQVVMPRLAELRTTDVARMLRGGRILSLWLLGATVAYSAILLGVLDVISPSLLGPKYGNIAPLVAAWCLVTVFQVARTGTVVILQVLKEFRAIALTNAACAIVTVIASAVLIRGHGVEGAIIGVGIGEFLFAIWLWKLCSRVGRKTQ